MNIFQYTAKLEELKGLKTLKSKETFAREIVKELTTAVGMYSIIKYEDIEVVSYLYKLLKLSVESYTGSSSLPMFVTDRLRTIRTNLIRLCRNPDSGITYTDMMKIFEFDSEIDFKSLYSEDMVTLIKLVDNNVPEIPITCSISTDTKYMYLSGSPSRFSEGAILLELESINKELGSTGQYTLLNSLLKDSYSKVTTEDLSNLSNTRDEVDYLAKVILDNPLCA